ncbi:MAG: outer membrane protein [Persicimonas sp.]
MIQRLLIVCLLFVAVNIAARDAQAAVYCNEHTRCPQGTSCVENRCVLEDEATAESQAAPDPNARQECGTDRRCRIRRLARKNRARRHAAQIREEKRLQRLIDAEYQREHDSIVRRADPWIADLHIRAETGTGLLVGYAVVPRIRVEGTFHYDDVDFYHDLDDRFVEGRHDFTEFGLGPTYYFYDSVFTPYARAAFSYRSGNFAPWGTGTVSLLDTEFHILTAGAGADAQFDNGFHMRVGLLYRYLVFNEASIDVGQYDDEVRQAFNDDFFPLDLELLIGWAF